MSITFEIVKFKKPTKDDLSNLHMFNPYGSIPILDDDGDSTGWNIYMFRVDDKDIQNIINSSYAVKMELPECITDYDSFLSLIFALYTFSRCSSPDTSPIAFNISPISTFNSSATIFLFLPFVMPFSFIC